MSRGQGEGQGVSRCQGVDRKKKGKNPRAKIGVVEIKTKNELSVAPNTISDVVGQQIKSVVTPYTNDVNYHQSKMMEKLENFLKLSE